MAEDQGTTRQDIRMQTYLQLTARLSGVSRRRPDPPRDVKFLNGYLRWEEPKDTSAITGYAIRVGRDDGAPQLVVPPGCRMVAVPSGSRAFVSSINSTWQLESEKIAVYLDGEDTLLDLDEMDIVDDAGASTIPAGTWQLRLPPRVETIVMSFGADSVYELRILPPVGTFAVGKKVTLVFRNVTDVNEIKLFLRAADGWEFDIDGVDVIEVPPRSAAEITAHAPHHQFSMSFVKTSGPWLRINEPIGNGDQYSLPVAAPNGILRRIPNLRYLPETHAVRIPGTALLAGFVGNGLGGFEVGGAVEIQSALATYRLRAGAGDVLTLSQVYTPEEGPAVEREIFSFGPSGILAINLMTAGGAIPAAGAAITATLVEAQFRFAGSAAEGIPCVVGIGKVISPGKVKLTNASHVEAPDPGYVKSAGGALTSIPAPIPVEDGGTGTDSEGGIVALVVENLSDNSIPQEKITDLVTHQGTQDGQIEAIQRLAFTDEDSLAARIASKASQIDLDSLADRVSALEHP